MDNNTEVFGNVTTLMPSNFTDEPDGHCTLFKGDQHKCDVILAVKRGMASLSFIGCLFMIFIIWLFRKYVIFTQRLILYLSIAALLDSIGLLMQGNVFEDNHWCDFQAWFVTYFDWTVLLWVCCITFNLYMLGIKGQRTESKEWAYHIVCWGIPFVISLLPFIGNHYGPSGLWCWIKDNWMWRFFIWYVPLFVGIIGLFATYTYITVTLNRKVRNWEGLYDPDVERKKKMLKDDIKPLRGYPFVYLAVSIFPLINRIQNSVSPDPVFALVLLHAISAPLQGALNAVVYGLDRDTASKLTPSQIKMAYRSWRYREKGLIREFPAETQDVLPPDMEGVTSNGGGGVDYRSTTAATLQVSA